MEIDFRALLKKYMDNVGENEGVHFLPYEGQKEFSDDEVAELEKISKEICEGE